MGRYMSLYARALFVHLVGVIVGLAGVCGWLFAFIGMRAARTIDQVRALLALYAMGGNVALGGVVLIGVGGSTWLSRPHSGSAPG